MTQIEKIKAEIERRMLEDYNSSDMLNDEIAQGVCAGILTFINSLQGESMSEDLKLASERYACKFSSSKYGHDKVKDAVIWGANWQREQMLKDAVEGVSLPQDEDLEKYEKEYFEKWKDDIISVYDRHAGLVDGAQWQKERMMKALLDMEKDSVEVEHKYGEGGRELYLKMLGILRSFEED